MARATAQDLLIGLERGRYLNGTSLLFILLIVCAASSGESARNYGFPQETRRAPLTAPRVPHSTTEPMHRTIAFNARLNQSSTVAPASPLGHRRGARSPQSRIRDRAAAASGSGNATPQFLEGLEYSTGVGPAAAAVGDLNHDGWQDLVVANSTDNTVSVLLGRGDGAFAIHVDYATGKGPSSVAMADLNGDGKLDLVVTNATDNTVSVLKGNGDGTFQPHMDRPCE